MSNVLAFSRLRLPACAPRLPGGGEGRSQSRHLHCCWAAFETARSRCFMLYWLGGGAARAGALPVNTNQHPFGCNARNFGFEAGARRAGGGAGALSVGTQRGHGQLVHPPGEETLRNQNLACKLSRMRVASCVMSFALDYRAVRVVRVIYIQKSKPHLQTRTYICMYACMHACMYGCMHVCIPGANYRFCHEMPVR